MKSVQIPLLRSAKRVRHDLEKTEYKIIKHV